MFYQFGQTIIFHVSILQDFGSSCKTAHTHVNRVFFSVFIPEIEIHGSYSHLNHRTVPVRQFEIKAGAYVVYEII